MAVLIVASDAGPCTAAAQLINQLNDEQDPQWQFTPRVVASEEHDVVMVLNDGRPQSQAAVREALRLNLNRPGLRVGVLTMVDASQLDANNDAEISQLAEQVCGPTTLNKNFDDESSGPLMSLPAANAKWSNAAQEMKLHSYPAKLAGSKIN